MTAREKMMRRLEFNRKILNILHEMLGNNEFLRFGQALSILGLNRDLFNIESADLYEFVDKKYKEFINSNEKLEKLD